MKKTIIFICSVIMVLTILVLCCWMIIFSPKALSRIEYIDVEGSEISKIEIHLDGFIEGVQGDAVFTEQESIDKIVERLASFEVNEALWYPSHNAGGEMGMTIGIYFYCGDEYVGGVMLSKHQYRMLIMKKNRLLFVDISPEFFQEMLDLYIANASSVSQ